jgi:Tol biopolymer transport system component
VSVVSSINRASVTIGALLVVAVALSWPAWQHLREAPPPPPPAVRGTWLPPAGLLTDADPERPFGLAVAADGRTAIVAGAWSGRWALWRLDLGGGAPVEIPGTDDAMDPALSPDGRRVAFVARGRLRTCALDGSDARDLADAPAPRGLAWLGDDALAFVPSTSGGIQRVTLDGTISPLTRVDAASGDTAHRFPQLAANGTALLLVVRSATPAREGVWLAALDGTLRTRLSPSTTATRATATHVLLWSDGALLAHRLDVDEGRLSARPDVLAGNVGRGPLDQLLVAVGGPVLLAAPAPDDRRSLRWLADGRPAEDALPPGRYVDVRLAPDGRRYAVTMPEPQLRTLDVYVVEPPGVASRGFEDRPRRVSLAIDADDQPVWAPGSDRLAYVQGGTALVTRPAQQGNRDTTIHRARTRLRLSDWTPDGRALVFSTVSPGTGDDLWTIPVAGGDPVSLVATPASETQGVVSPDGRWLAYVTDVSGQPQVVVDRMAAPGRPQPVTVDGGVDPRWRRDGRALFVRGGARIYRIDLALDGDRLTPAAPQPVGDRVPGLRGWDVSPDGSRLLVTVPAATDAVRPATLLVHWQSLLSPAPVRKRNQF